jgi:hypothetical protein
VTNCGDLAVSEHPITWMPNRIVEHEALGAS